MGRPFLIKKKCSKCKHEFPATNEYFFYRNKAKGYLSSFCKSCSKLYKQENSARHLELQRNRRGLVSCRKCGTDNKEKGSTYCGACMKEKKKHRKKIDKAVYKSRLRKARPVWADKNALREFYINRPEGMHVDHIIPIRGNNVCGLHTIENLQYLTAKDNIKKGNHYSITHWGAR